MLSALGLLNGNDISCRDMDDTLCAINKLSSGTNTGSMSVALRTTRFYRAATHARGLATASGLSSSTSAFKATLAVGPSFEEFLSEGDKERVVLGNISGYVNFHKFTCT